MVKFFFMGLVNLDVQSIFWSICKIQILYYLVDVQSCLFEFFFNGYSLDEIRINIIDREVVGNDYKENSVWEFKNGEVFVREGKWFEVDVFIVSVLYEWRFIIYVIIVIVLILLMGFVYMLVFFFLDDFGECVGFFVIVLLLLVVYQSMLSEVFLKVLVLQILIISIKVFVDFLISVIIQMCVIFS